MMTVKGVIKQHLKLTGVVTLKNALTLYARYGIVANRLWTTSAALEIAGVITGSRYNPHRLDSYYVAIKDLERWIDQHGGTY
jgi:hypothetical protein